MRGEHRGFTYSVRPSLDSADYVIQIDGQGDTDWFCNVSVPLAAVYMCRTSSELKELFMRHIDDAIRGRCGEFT